MKTILVNKGEIRAYTVADGLYINAADNIHNVMDVLWLGNLIVSMGGRS